MEASKCPKCGEEPSFVEHMERWYCYECNTYLDGEIEEEEEEHVKQTERVDAISQELQALEQEKFSCKKCGAELEEIADGKLYCYVCETYPSDSPVEEAAEEARPAVKANEAQALLDVATAETELSKTCEPAAESEATTVAQAAEEKVQEAGPAASAPKEPVVEAETSVKLCVTCGHPLKWIEKYSRHYCYGCKKYAPKEGSEKPAPPAPVKPAAKNCPECGGELKFIEKYKEFYCHKCKKYPFHQKKTKTEKQEEAKPSQPKPTNDGTPKCPKCAKELRWIEKYSRHYCNACKEYAPKGYAPAPKGEGKKVCPACKSEMKFIPEYNEWYCYKCKKYSLRPSKPVMLF